MSKKKRKTRREKESQTTHQFSHIVTSDPIRQAEVVSIDTAKPKVKAEVVKPHVMKDLRKVITIIGIVIAFVVVMSILAYYTKILNGFFGIFHIKY